MTSIDHEPVTTAGGTTRKPLDSEIDVYGLTHQGLVRKTNQDNSWWRRSTKRIDVKFSSLAPGDDNISGEERLAFIMMVADGVGGTEHGEAASRLAVESVSNYVSEAMRCYYGAQPTASETSLAEVLEQGARQCHESVCRHAEEQTIKSMAPRSRFPRRVALDLRPQSVTPAATAFARPNSPRSPVTRRWRRS
jgi:hypothetical protein